MELNKKPSLRQALSLVECEGCFIHFQQEKIREKFCQSCEYKRGHITYNHPIENLKSLGFIVAVAVIVGVILFVWGVVESWHTALLK